MNRTRFAFVLCCCCFLLAAARAASAEPFTIVVLPDTQYYTEVQWKTDQYFMAQTKWIVDNRQNENIVFVSHVGDLQQDGTFLRTDDHQADPEVKELLVNIDPNNPPKNTRQWERCSAAMKVLDDADIPYVACAGNHDFEHWGTIRNPLFFVKYFGPERFSGKNWFGGGSPASSTMPAGINTCQFFTAGGYKFLSIGLRFAPDAEDMAWAQKLIDDNPGLPTLISTHDYQNTKGRDENGKRIWETLVRRNPQIFLVLSGHVNGAHQQTSVDDAGLPVFEMLSDYQDLECSRKTGYDKDYAHGGGFLRLVRFEPEQNQIEVKTYSPVIKKYMTDKDNQFTVNVNFAERFAARPAGATASRSEDLSNVLGVTHVNGKYYLTKNDYLNEGADAVLATGSRVIKLYFQPSRYPWNSNWPSDLHSLTEIAQTPYFRSVFAKPFKTFIITSYSIGHDKHNYFTEGLTEEDKANETRQFYELTKHLLTTYRGTGKTFVLQHWEGDWALRDINGHTFDPTFTPPQLSIDSMIQWLNARQAGIIQARNEIKDSDVHVYGAAEANRVVDSMSGRPGVANSVLPNTNVDLISYSAWDSQQDAAKLSAAVDYLASQMPATAAFGKTTRSVYIGEFGGPENAPNGHASIDQIIDNVVSVTRSKHLPWAVYWEIYCNELADGAPDPPVNGNNNAVKGHWMIKPDGTPGVAWYRYRELLAPQDAKARRHD